ncbi:pyrimidine reductase family protein [Nocardia cyriacigeorgica]|uniref:Pyrimidine reductase family protein n=2 Tax=Nocardia cyriacigeorgica TaxID=135487 RepID=A0A6P1CIW3_9NOCA|nr:pyrimidine reductase family protein [Nocardia cyriacigeorgica]MBF6080808.1 pyrimidine reductase family protein [Nocardia cyriacigeorgica]MBF6284690.1 pyrimidine reductase family protein [Nocardia cyriacigeorgica]MBF6423643.1 pyrimidine reductase family protein [Nocardia cyriacigeorgica]NEW31234.1 pyrimidine reductase family protein [Nocardia cyriacigeorgica]CCF64388.1 putative 5-amino-6-(5-phosphoribosylamino)uracil reductase [Nocardia cyriacigeorgica GUH-2]
MQRIHNAIQLTGLTDEELFQLYGYPTGLDRPWVRANFVSSIDGAVSSDGVSGGLGTDADAKVFHALRELADVVLVGAGTVRTENYGPAKTDPALRRRLHELGLGGHPDGTAPPIAVVTAGAALDPAGRLFPESLAVAPLIITTAAAPAIRKQQLADAGAEVIEAGDVAVSPQAMLAALAERGLLRVLCEGGPRLFGDLLGADRVDELCLTTAPVLIGGTAPRISLSREEFRVAMRPAHILLDEDATMLIRWVRT